MCIHHFTLVVASLLLAASVCSFGAEPNHIFADTNSAKFTIVTPVKPSEAVATAASELKHYLDKITGANFKIVDESVKIASPCLYVGQSDFVKRKLDANTLQKLGDGFVVRSYNSDFIIAGGDPRGTLYGVYSFLEKELGCRWLTTYGDEIVPKQTRLILPKIVRTEQPAFAVRDLCVQSTPGVLRPKYMEFLARNRNQGPDMNFLGDTSKYGGTSHHYAFPPNDGWMVHTFFHWLPPDQYFESHPDYYSLIKGKRVKSQLCFSNVELRDYLTEKIINHIGATDQSGNYALSAQDDDGILCECPECTALAEKYKAVGAPLYDYLTELGPKLHAKYPKAYITTLAYRKSQTERAPVGLKMPDNVIIIFAPIDDNFAHSLLHPDNAETLSNLRNWSKITKHLWVWYYPNPYGPVLPQGNFGRMADDFKVFKSVGVEGVFSEHDTAGVFESKGLINMQTWVMTKLLWNPNQDLKALVNDFASKYYGKASPYIIKYYDAIESARRTTTSKMSWNPSLVQHRFLVPELLINCQKIFDDAENAVSDDPDMLLRVRQARMSLDNACVLLYPSVADHFNRTELINRYTNTFNTTKRKHIDPNHKPENPFAIHLAMTPLKPLVGLLEGVDLPSVLQLTPENAVVYKECKVVVDPDAAAGIAAVTDECGEEVFQTGYYDSLTTIQTNLYLRMEDIKPGGYHLYKIGTSVLNEQCYVWMGKSWHVQLRDIPQFYDPGNSGKKYDIYVSLKFEGPYYGTQSPENSVYMDRVILVPVN